MRFVRPLYPLRKFYTGLTWRVPTVEKKIYLTFDDGPVPEITPWVLDLLKKFDAKGTFFCVGENIEKHPELYRQVIQGGHAVGNHTYNHLNGWRTDNKLYLENILKCSEVMNSTSPPQMEGLLFRPPYGKIRKSQIKTLLRFDSHFPIPKSSIILWDVLSYDFDRTISREKCLKNVLQYSREGSVVVFHDSIKAQRNLEYVLPKTLEVLGEQGFRFCNLIPDML